MKPSSSAAPAASPVPLRLIHGIVFGGFSAICVVAGWPEVQHLVRAQLQPYHAGPPPRVQLVLAVLAVLVGMIAIAVQGVRGRSARLSWSALILTALVVTLWSTHEGPMAGRTADSANLKILLAARDLNERMVSELQGRGTVSEGVDAWQTTLEQVSKRAPSPVRTHSFQSLPLRIQKVDAPPESLPAGAVPGTLLLYVMGGGVAYELHPVGISSTGSPWLLRSPTGEAVVFRGAFNPGIQIPTGGGVPGAQ